ncbi:unnamed protein product, partial [Laminaria digitata]
NRANAPLVEKEWGYIYCIDLSDPAGPRVIVRTQGGENDPGARGGFYLRAGRRIQVVVRVQPMVTKVVASLSGDASSEVSTTFDAVPKFLVPGSPRAISIGTFIGRKSGYVKLEVEFGNSGEQGSFSREIRIEDVYKGALKLGVLAGVAPSDHAYSLAAASQDSKYIRVDAGGSGLGIPVAELVVGYTWFLLDIHERRNNFSVGPYVGLGVVRTDAKGVVPISSVLVGFDFSFGMSFSATLVAGLRRTTQLDNSFGPGSLVAGTESEVPEHFAITPQFGVVFNLS